ELAVVLVDARNGVVEQTRRHAAVAALLRVPHVVLAVNKMDLVDHAEPVFAAIAEEFTAYTDSLGIPD
uniref:GTP-binding protein n=1 Tax=Streptomyces sp. CA2R106 TaxID=3120153 RepID=UPI00300A0A27